MTLADPATQFQYGVDEIVEESVTSTADGLETSSPKAEVPAKDTLNVEVVVVEAELVLETPGGDAQTEDQLKDPVAESSPVTTNISLELSPIVESGLTSPPFADSPTADVEGPQDLQSDASPLAASQGGGGASPAVSKVGQLECRVPSPAKAADVVDAEDVAEVATAAEEVSVRGVGPEEFRTSKALEPANVSEECPSAALLEVAEAKVLNTEAAVAVLVEKRSKEGGCC